MERPFIYANKKGEVEAFMMACDDVEPGVGSSIIIWPVDKWTPNAKAQVDKKLLVHYEFNEASGQVVKDVSGNAQHGTVVDNPKWNTAVGRDADNMGALDMKKGHVKVPASVFTKIDNEITISFWTSDEAGHVMNDDVAFDAWNGSKHRIMKLDLGKKLLWAAGRNHEEKSDSSKNQGLFLETASIQPAKDLKGWVHWALVRDSISGSISIYRNAKLVKKKSGTYGPFHYGMAGIDSFTIGKSQAKSSQSFGAYMADFKIFGRVLTANEIYQDFSGSSNIPPVPVASATPYQGAVPLNVTLNASGSSDDGKIVAYRWDIDNDGVFDYNNTTPIQNHKFTSNALHIVSLEVEDDGGLKRQTKLNVATGKVNISDGLLLHWKLDESDTAGPAKDSSGNGAHGKFNGSNTKMTAGKIKNSVYLQVDPGNDGYVNVDKKGLLSDASAFSVSFWLKPEKTTHYNQTIQANGGWGSFAFSAAGSGAGYCGISVGDRFQFENGTVQDNVWQHFVFTYANGVGKLYKNNHELMTKKMSPGKNWDSFSLGIPRNGNGRTIQGNVDDLRIYNKALSLEEIVFIGLEAAE